MVLSLGGVGFAFSGSPPIVPVEKTLDQRAREAAAKDAASSPTMKPQSTHAPGEPGDLIPIVKIDAKTVKQLRRDFKRQLEDEAKEMKRTQAREFKETRASGKQNLKDWERQEKSARHAFFEQNSHGPERRAYIKDFLVRREAQLALRKEREKNLRNEQDVRRKSLELEQAQRLREFEDFLGRSERPPQILWGR